MSELELLRKQIDDIDNELCSLFEKRMKIAKIIGNYKKNNNIEVLDSNRESEIKELSKKRLNDKELEGYYLELVDKLLELSKRYQKE